MGKQSRVKELRKGVQAEDQKLFLEGQAAGRRMEALGIDPPPACHFTQLQHIFSSIYAVTVAGWIDGLGEDRTPEAITRTSAVLAKQMGRFERLAFQIFELDREDKPDCKMGCHWCCHVRVTIKPHEAIALRHAVSVLSAEARARAEHRLQTLAAEISDMPAEELIRLRRLCPLNEHGRCTVYESRPLGCRTTHSYNVRGCEAYARQGTLLQARVNGIVMEFGRAFALATNAALAHLGLDARSYDLSTIVSSLLADPMLERKAASGEQHVFDALYRQDAVELAVQDMERIASGVSPDPA